MTASTQPLLNMLAVDISKSQDKRGSQTVGFRFREQLQDLISRLDECVFVGSRTVAPETGCTAAGHVLSRLTNCISTITLLLDRL